MSELKLRADANAFVPSFMSPVAAAPKTPDDSFDRMAKDIESEIVDEEVGELSAVMNDTGIGSNNTSQTSGLPAHLSKHAAEFWFPESRYVVYSSGLLKKGLPLTYTNELSLGFSFPNFAEIANAAKTSSMAASVSHPIIMFVLVHPNSTFGGAS